MIQQPGFPVERVELDDAVLTIGRSPDCDIPIRDRYLSRKHAAFRWSAQGWVIDDHGSANGTFVNGERVDGQLSLSPGDRITLGDSSIVIEGSAVPSSGSIQVRDGISETSISIPVPDIDDSKIGAERLEIENRLAIALLEDRPLAELFDFIVDQVLDLLEPSRVALGILTEDRTDFEEVRVRSNHLEDGEELRISRTLLREVVDERKALAFTDVSEDENLAQARSIIGQQIRSALCAPLIWGGEVRGVLYLDYQLQARYISEDDVRLATRIARIAALKLETTKLREESIVKQRMEAELKTAYTVQARILPAEPPAVEGFRFAARNRPCWTVSGDYYDYKVTDDGKVWFVIADVSGKGITAALIMASLATAFSIFATAGRTPAEVVKKINETLVPRTSPTKFVTLFAAVLDPTTGMIEFTNAGHTPPLLIRRDRVERLDSTDMVVGIFAGAVYRDQKVQLYAGDALIMFTDGVIEAENEAGDEYGLDRVVEVAKGLHGKDPCGVIDEVEGRVIEFTEGHSLGDDVTLLSVCRDSA